MRRGMDVYSRPGSSRPAPLDASLRFPVDGTMTSGCRSGTRVDCARYRRDAFRTVSLSDSTQGDSMNDVEEIQRLKARYFRTMDTKDWAAMREVFTDDVVVDTSEAGGEVVEGADEFLTFLRGVLDGAVTVHQGHMPEIELTSETTATGIWALHDIVIVPDRMRLDGYGHYHETYVKGVDGWRIASSKLTRLHVDLVALEAT